MKEWIKWAIVGVAMGAGVYGLVKAGEYLYSEYLKDTIDKPEYDQVLDDLKDEMRPIWEGDNK